MNPVIYVCPYCGTEHDEPNASCCHEKGHCEPRAAYPDVDTHNLLEAYQSLAKAISGLEFKDYHTRSDKSWLRDARFKAGIMMGELIMRGAL